MFVPELARCLEGADVQAYHRDTGINSDDLVRNIQRLPHTQHSSIAEYHPYLSEHEPDMMRALVQGMGSLPYHVIHETFGGDGPLLWTAASAFVNRLPARMDLHHGVDMLGIDADIATMGAIALREKPDVTYRSLTLSMRLVDQVRMYHDQLVNMPELLRVCAINTSPTYRFPSKRYGLAQKTQIYPTVASQPRTNMNNECLVLDPGITYNLYTDASCMFILTYDGVPQCKVGFEVNQQDGSLLIKQLQGVRAVSTKGDRIPPRGIGRLDWCKLMVGTTAMVADKLAIDHVAIQPGAYNDWTRGKSPHLSNQRATEIYDTTAKRLGFTRKGTNDYWVLPTSQLMRACSDTQ